MKFLLLVILNFFFISQFVNAQSFNNWRGPDRDGHYHETNLLKSWPANGPRMLWAFEDLGKGFSSAVPDKGRIYVTGLEEDMGYVYILTQRGQFLKKYPYGNDISSSYPGSRSTPTIAGNLMYIATGHGELVCLNLDNGEKVWIKGLFTDFDGNNIRWGFTESVVVDGDVIFASPGGSRYNIVALNRHTGDLIWTSRAAGGLSAYCSPLLFEHNERKIFTTIMEKDIVGLDPQTGELLWSYPYTSQRSIHPNTPIYQDGFLYAFNGYGKGGYKLRISPDGNSITKEWENSTMDPKTGGAVLLDGYVYGSGDRNRRWFGVDWNTGEIVHESRDIDVGTVITADGMLYAYTERGELALLRPNNGRFTVVSQTRIELGSDQHWAHLVINDGILYVRRGNALMAFDIKS